MCKTPDRVHIIPLRHPEPALRAKDLGFSKRKRFARRRVKVEPNCDVWIRNDTENYGKIVLSYQ